MYSLFFRELARTIAPAHQSGRGLTPQISASASASVSLHPLIRALCEPGWGFRIPSRRWCVRHIPSNWKCCAHACAVAAPRRSPRLLSEDGLCACRSGCRSWVLIRTAAVRGVFPACDAPPGAGLCVWWFVFVVLFVFVLKFQATARSFVAS